MPSRTELKTTIRSLPVWDEVSREYRSKIKKASKQDPYAKCLQDAMNNGRAGIDVYRECAKNNGISDKLSGVWND